MANLKTPTLSFSPDSGTRKQSIVTSAGTSAFPSGAWISLEEAARLNDWVDLHDFT
jgi:hypothetical protein